MAEHRTVFASAARTATVTSDDIVAPREARGLRVVIDVTAVTATPSVVFTIRAKDPASGKYVTLLASAAITAVGTTVLVVYPGTTAAANAVANLPLGSIVSVLATHADADSITYSVGIDFLP